MAVNKFTLHIMIVLCGCIGIALSCRGGTILQNGVTEQDKKEILENHNRLRALVAKGNQPGQPGAENMMEMIWDEELARRAQEWANECIFQHDPRRVVDRFTMGQNIAIMWSTAPLDEDGDFPSRIQKWFDEVNLYSFGAKWSPKTGHYSQLVWSDTHLVGCGFTYYKTSTKWNKIFVCNYGPGGNVEGSLPYAVGQPDCSNHGMSASSHYSGLCASAEASGQIDNKLTDTETSVAEFNKLASIFNRFSSFTKTSHNNQANKPRNGQFNAFFNRVQGSVSQRTQTSFNAFHTKRTHNFGPFNFANRVRRSSEQNQNQYQQGVPIFRILHRV